MNRSESELYRILPVISYLHGREGEEALSPPPTIDLLQKMLHRPLVKGEENQLSALVEARARDLAGSFSSSQGFIRLLLQLLARVPGQTSVKTTARVSRVIKTAEQLLDYLQQSALTGCRQVADRQVAQLTALQDWIEDLPADLAAEPWDYMNEKISRLLDQVVKVLPTLNTDCRQMGRQVLADQGVREIDTERLLKPLHQDEEALSRDLFKRVDTFYRRYRPDGNVVDAEKLRFTLQEIRLDHPDVHEIPELLNQMVERIYRWMISEQMIPESFAPPRVEFNWLRCNRVTPWLMWHREADNTQQVSLSPPTVSYLDEYQQEYNYARLEAMAMHISARGILYRTTGRYFHPHWLPREHIEGWQFHWVRKLISSGYGKGELRLRIMLLREELHRVRGRQAVLRFHLQNADEQEIGASLIHQGIFSETSALELIGSVLTEPGRVGVGYVTWKELASLRRRIHKLNRERFSLLKENQLLMRSLATPPGGISRQLNELLEAGIL